MRSALNLLINPVFGFRRKQFLPLCKGGIVLNKLQFSKIAGYFELYTITPQSRLRRDSSPYTEEP